MGRPAKGWSLRYPKGSSVLAVRFTWQGKDVERTTGERDHARAAVVAAEIYSACVRGKRPQARARVVRVGIDDVATLGGKWLATQRGRLDERTIDCYLEYFDQPLGPFFVSLSRVTPDRVREFIAQELQRTEASTVRKKLSALRGMVGWALPLENARELVPGVPKRAKGRRYRVRRRGKATPLSPIEVQRFLSLLPEWSRTRRGKRWPIRARFILAYETSLRPATLSALSVPEHWAPGATSLILTDELDKARFGREVPLTRAAAAALESVATSAGILFGTHDYRSVVRSAARRAGLPKHRVETLAPYDLRHAALTHWCEKSSNLAGVQAMAGHKHISTTARYVKPSLRAARSLLSELGRSASPGGSGNEPPGNGAEGGS